MVKWDYLICYCIDVRRDMGASHYVFRADGTNDRLSLEDLGKDGWELAGVDDRTYIFKRPAAGK